MSVKQFSDSLGKERPQWAYDVLNPEKKVGISKNIADLISEHYPQFNKAWLLTGEGDMLNKGGDPNAKSVGGDMSDYETWLLPQTTHGGSLTNMPADGVLMQNCERIISPIKGVDFAITVYGDSMAPEYPSTPRCSWTGERPTYWTPATGSSSRKCCGAPGTDSSPATPSTPTPSTPTSTCHSPRSTASTGC